MKRQKSILSYLQKPSPEEIKTSTISSDTDMLPPPPHLPTKQNNQNHFISDHSSVPTMKKDPSPDIFGTDTPPEKLPRQVLPVKFQASDVDGDDTKPSLFSSILHKFSKVASDNSVGRNKVDDGSVNGCSTISKNAANEGCFKQETTPSKYAQGGNVSKLNDNYGDVGHPLDVENLFDLLGPETPAMRPLVPRFKRVQQDFIGFDDTKNVYPLFDSSKRARLSQDPVTGKNVSRFSDSSRKASLLQDPVSEKKQCTEASEANISKFEWLNPSSIRDANGRRPGDALYDKRTLYIPPDVLKKMSASQSQYWSFKCQYMDVLLFFKVGKFYELYELDAEIANKELDWKITFSGVGRCRQAGISEAGIDDAVQKLIARGYKVGRVEQTETSDQAKARGRTAIIQRKLVQVVTPSTTVDGNIGPGAVHLLALKEDSCGLENGSAVYGFAFVDCASLKFWVGSVSDDASCAALGALLMQVSPKEVIYQSRGLSKEAHKALKKYSSTGSTMLQLTPSPSVTDFVDALEVKKLIHSKGYFRGSSNSWDCALEGVIHHDATISALGGLVGHLSRLMLDDVLANGEVLPYQVYKGCLRMDGQTLINLEIFTNNADGGATGTLYKYLDSCVTSSGKRLLRNWICHPLKEVGEINCRLNVVEELIKHSEITLIVAQYLRKLPDLERLLGRVKAIVGSSASLLMPLLGAKLLRQRIKSFGSLIKRLRIGIDLLLILQQKEQDMSSLSKVLDVPLLCGSDGLNEFLTQFEAAIDSDFPHYQDHDVADSDAETLAVLIELFVEKATQWSQVIHALSCIDVLRSFAVTANSSCGSMCRPVLLPVDSRSMVSCQETGGPILTTKGLWHPYAFGETGGTIVPNDVYLGEDSTGCCPRTLLLTGPNMGGKSTLLRATCLAVILAQLGCFVPCETCVLSPVDIIFTRLGATDRIMAGESTFFIECMETASVLQNATNDSLVILDELGRGTSTFDGYAIAYAVFRHLVEKVHCRLLFATHYHSLTKEFASHPHVKLQHMACAFKPTTSSSSFKGDQELVFLYQLTSGACPESYGLQVALMAGISKKVVEVASKASQVMKRSVEKNFKSSEQRSSFSTLHEDWLKTIVAISKMTEECSLDEDACDTLLCLWHEMKSLYRYQME